MSTMGRGNGIFHLLFVSRGNLTHPLGSFSNSTSFIKMDHLYPYSLSDVHCLSIWTLLVPWSNETTYFSFMHLMMRPLRSETIYHSPSFPYHLAQCLRMLKKYLQKQKSKVFLFSLLELLLVIIPVNNGDGDAGGTGEGVDGNGGGGGNGGGVDGLILLLVVAMVLLLLVVIVVYLVVVMTVVMVVM